MSTAASSSAVRNPRVLVLTGDGINCETETAQSFELAGFKAQITHINDLITSNYTLDDLSSSYSVLALPGGFSFGDDLGSGRLLALKIKHGLKWDLNLFVKRGGLVIGICNGFQALIRMGVYGKDVSITHNIKGKFINQWVKVSPSTTKCIWLKGMGTFDLPVRHGEGRIVFHPGSRMGALNKLTQQGMLALRYEHTPNGSEENLAGLCDPTGRIFGLMPHPEAFARWSSHPDWTSQASGGGASGEGLYIFENAYSEVLASK